MIVLSEDSLRQNLKEEVSMVSRQLLSGVVALAPAGRFLSLNGTKTFTRAAVAATMKHATLITKDFKDSRTCHPLEGRNPTTHVKATVFHEHLLVAECR